MPAKPSSRRVVAGRLTGVFGIRGELKCLPTLAGAGAFVPGAALWIGDGPGARAVRCRGSRRHHEKLLVAFDGVETPEAARAYTGAEVFAEAPPVELGDGEYLDADLVGLRLIDEAGVEIARVTGVVHYPAQDCLVVDPGGALVPLVKAFVRSIDVAAGTIATTLPEGLLDQR